MKPQKGSQFNKHESKNTTFHILQLSIFHMPISPVRVTQVKIQPISRPENSPCPFSLQRCHQHPDRSHYRLHWATLESHRVIDYELLCGRLMCNIYYSPDLTKALDPGVLRNAEQVNEQVND